MYEDASFVTDVDLAQGIENFEFPELIDSWRPSPEIIYFALLNQLLTSPIYLF